MKLFALCALLLAAPAAAQPVAAPAPSTAAVPDAFQGEWWAMQEYAEQRFRWRLVVKGNRATLYSVDQGNKELTVDTLSAKDDSLDFSVKAVEASFSGKLNGSFLVGQFTQDRPYLMVFSHTPITATE